MATNSARRLYIGERFDGFHRFRRTLRVAERLIIEKLAAQRAGFVDRIAHPQAEQAIPGMQMVVDERKRCAHREGVEPECHLGEFHGHRIFVHAIDATLQHHAPDDMPVIELFFVDSPVRRPRVFQDGDADVLDLVGKRRGIMQVRTQRSRFRHRIEHMIGKRIDKADKEMTRSHRGVTNAQAEDRVRRIGRAQFAALIILRILRGEFAERRAEGIQPFGDEGFECFIEDQADEFVRRVIAPRILAGEEVGAHGERTSIVTHNLKFEQPFVDRPQLLNRQIYPQPNPSNAGTKHCSHRRISIWQSGLEWAAKGLSHGPLAHRTGGSDHMTHPVRGKRRDRETAPPEG